MAPRTEHEPKKHHRINPSARDCQYLNAHTGTGVNKHRPVSGRGNSRVSSTYKSSHQGSQSGSHHVRISSPDVRAVEHPKICDEHTHSKDDRNGIGKLHIQHHRLHLPNGTDPSDSKASAAPSSPHKKHTSSSPSPSSSSSSSSLTSATQPPDISTIKPPDTRTSTRTIIAIPKPPLLAHRPRRCIDPVKRAFTNHNLRAILSDKPWPTERKKASVEKMVLKMGMKREYK
ncbi:hypothetical protein COCSADRAFT_156741 [Bipolaris sorokiniana ND90Pr]|uniref:Uncharacterized protein n=1 Tax=Cochliobolus sativus (strain ND90Pr / ATCC 201652) TaxID=665912 RepID=M2SMA0_COCSN|nr:uncharacterized protein COCSADRAFT_156741 [Bipolaris sorokiniana ND90Pr]EMD68298.1 hypothetical protein COCSADRAFT_156741 [Bipolaris sorokiniana ND90Pr]